MKYTGVKEDIFQMQKFNVHVLTLLVALVFCVGLINLADGTSEKNAEAKKESGLKNIPTLSSAVYQYHQQLRLPELSDEDSALSEYQEIIRHELSDTGDSQNLAVDSALEQGKTLAVVEVQATETVKPDVKTTVKKAADPVTKVKKKDYVERWAVVTAYCPCSKCCGYATPGRTSIGKSAWKPGIAADPRAIPYGTEIYVKGYGRQIVDDTGGAMRHSWRRKGVLHLDIRMTYHYQAVKWGRKMMKVRIYNK